MPGSNVRNYVGLVLAVVCVLISVASAGIGDGGSKCADASCTPAPVGAQCDPKYERDDGCCPVWHCSNGQTAYGVSKSSSGASGSSFSYSSSSNGMPMQPMQPMQFPPMGNPFQGFGSLFGGLFGRR